MEHLLSPKDVAEWLGVPVSTIYGWRSQAPVSGPRGFRVGKHVRYRPSDVETWIKAQADSGMSG